MSADEGRVRSQQIDIQIVEVELAHLFAFALVALSVMIQRGLPARGCVRAREEGQIRRAPISPHETFEIMRVPRVYLRL